MLPKDNSLIMKSIFFSKIRSEVIHNLEGVEPPLFIAFPYSLKYRLHWNNVMFCTIFLQGVDEMYDAALAEFFTPYHMLVDLICRVAVNHQSLSEPIINLS